MRFESVARSKRHTTSLELPEAVITSQIRILSVDDHPLMREGIASALSLYADMRIVAQAANGRDAICTFRDLQPDVTLMDLRLPDISGIDATISIRAEFPDARIIILTTY